MTALTPYHAKYFAWELTKRSPSGTVERLAGAIASAQVDLNPHQVDAALFAFQSPLAKGAILADEVGLGKTIEAGLIISQKWAERKRRILVITPSNLRKQWHQELSDKFFLPCRILEGRSYNAAVKSGDPHPFEAPEIIICSYQFARFRAVEIAKIPWDIAVIDEAHRLRNVYKPNNVIANALKNALEPTRKLLLTATPLQNSLLELYGLVSFVDAHTFGDLKSFREQFANLTQQQVFDTLKSRLKPVCHRTLRRQVTTYISYTKRLPLVEDFTPDEGESRLYFLVSHYLQRENLQALPSGQRALLTLVLRKLLASSTFAIAGALTAMSNRLKAKLAASDPPASSVTNPSNTATESNQPSVWGSHSWLQPPFQAARTESPTPLQSTLAEDYEALDETADETIAADDPIEEAATDLIDAATPEDDNQPLSDSDRLALQREIADLDDFAQLARSIDHNAKGRALLKALVIAFNKAREIGAREKAIIFTESRRTQAYLLRLLADSPFSQGIVLFNGSNTDDGSKAIYSAWLQRHKGSDRVTGSRTADMRSALVDYFRDEGRIMIATEAGAEGINLQFCSLVVNYDLPWNPQRIEQRIGRCHRYGQKHDVVVVNFVNRQNAADNRVFQLLSEKFQLFEGIFGASDEVLGAIESGVDFEKRIAEIYQRSRKPEEIQAAFDQLQSELSLEINEAMTSTRRKLLENFDDEVREKLIIRDKASIEALTRFDQLLMELARHELAGCAEFAQDTAFRLTANPFSGQHFPLGPYELRGTGDAHLFRLSHPLAEAMLDRAKARDLPPAEVLFDYTGYEGKVTILHPLVGQSGWLELSILTVAALDQTEDHLIWSAVTDADDVLDEETSTRLLRLPGRVAGTVAAGTSPAETLADQAAARIATLHRDITERNNRFFEAEAEKLDGWADDLKVGLEREIKELDRQIKEARRAATTALTLQEKLHGQKQVKTLEQQRSDRRRSLFDAQDAVDRQREGLIAKIESKLAQLSSTTRLFAIRWRVE